jgi:hypothetical protein
VGDLIEGSLNDDDKVITNIVIELGNEEIGLIELEVSDGAPGEGLVTECDEELVVGICVVDEARTGCMVELLAQTMLQVAKPPTLGLSGSEGRR